MILLQHCISLIFHSTTLCRLKINSNILHQCCDPTQCINTFKPSLTSSSASFGVCIFQIPGAQVSLCVKVQCKICRYAEWIAACQDWEGGSIRNFANVIIQIQTQTICENLPHFLISFPQLQWYCTLNVYHKQKLVFFAPTSICQLNAT